MNIELPPLRAAQESWQSVLGQLQMEMPRASFDTWVRDTQVASFDGKVLTVSVRNNYARDWLELRLTSTISRLLIGIMNQPVAGTLCGGRRRTGRRTRRRRGRKRAG